ncbi:hypothetical protein Dimus_005455 [Dionaea muscipula]
MADQDAATTTMEAGCCPSQPPPLPPSPSTIAATIPTAAGPSSYHVDAPSHLTSIEKGAWLEGSGGGRFHG